jgi:hypothetical protein
VKFHTTLTVRGKRKPAIGLLSISHCISLCCLVVVVTSTHSPSHHRFIATPCHPCSAVVSLSQPNPTQPSPAQPNTLLYPPLQVVASLGSTLFVATDLRRRYTEGTWWVVLELRCIHTLARHWSSDSLTYRGKCDLVVVVVLLWYVRIGIVIHNELDAYFYEPSILTHILTHSHTHSLTHVANCLLTRNLLPDDDDVVAICAPLLWLPC